MSQTDNRVEDAKAVLEANGINYFHLTEYCLRISLESGGYVDFWPSKGTWRSKDKQGVNITTLLYYVKPDWHQITLAKLANDTATKTSQTTGAKYVYHFYVKTHFGHKDGLYYTQEPIDCDGAYEAFKSFLQERYPNSVPVVESLSLVSSK